MLEAIFCWLVYSRWSACRRSPFRSAATSPTASGAKKTYIIGCVTMGVFGFVYFGLIDTCSSVLIFIAMMLSLIPHDIQYPQAALIAESFTPRPRYSGASIAGSITAGGPGSVSRHSSGPRSPVRSDARRDPLWEFAAVPARSPAALAREQPDLEALERIFVAIVFGMTNACSGTHESNRHLESVVRSLIHLGDYATLQFQPIPLRDPANNFAVSGGLHLYRKATPKRYLRERLNPLLRLCMRQPPDSDFSWHHSKASIPASLVGCVI
jgi:hypothetical protein